MVSRRVLLSLLALGTVGALTTGTYATFSSGTGSTNNNFAAGTVILSDNDVDAAVVALATANPGGSSTGCIRVLYGGSLDSNLRLYATLTGTLGPYLTLTVTRGSDSSPSFSSCAAFTADSTDYIGQGAGVIYQGNVSAFPTSWAAGIVDGGAGTPEVWDATEAHSYKFVVTLQDVEAAQGLTGTARFLFEARNT